MGGVRAFKMDENQDFAAHRDASNFIQLYAEGGLRCCQFFRELLQGIRGTVNNCRWSV